MTGSEGLAYREATLGYYRKNADGFVCETADAGMAKLQAAFAGMLPRGGRVLDLGCGSGRDSLAFARAGFDVCPMDGSPQMCAAARRLTGLRVDCATFEEYEPQGVYDGIWACSSLLHLPGERLAGVVAKYAAVLREGGVFYMSFKLGSFEGMRNGRWFTDMTEETLRAVLERVPLLRLESAKVTADVRPGREGEKWLNAWCVRV
ncbi:MAG: class I SAM-dependent methyltransferase [Coriobacteriia bacterium]|nr:class I SAM-dependent methyltransferase [Coriobacteriia bacterium]